MSTRRTVPAASIVVRPGGQDRTRFDDEYLRTLAASIAEDGCLTPPTVRETSAGFELVYGECRTRAMRDILGWTDIVVDVDDIDDRTASRRMLVENVVRSDLDPMAEARAYRERIERFDMEPAAIARECGIPVSRIRNRLRLLDLTDHVAHYVETRQLPLGHAQIMSQLDGNRQALALAAYNAGPLGIDVFTRVVGRLADEQAQETASGLFDGADFLQVEEWVRDAEELVRVATAVEVVREPCLGMEEIATELGMSVSQVRARIRKEAFPAADLVVGGAPAWWASTVDEWCRDNDYAANVPLVASA